MINVLVCRTLSSNSLWSPLHRAGAVPPPMCCAAPLSCYCLLRRRAAPRHYLARRSSCDYHVDVVTSVVLSGKFTKEARCENKVGTRLQPYTDVFVSSKLNGNQTRQPDPGEPQM